MNIPSEIWSIILENTTDKKSCKNLYKALSCPIQKDLEKIYNDCYRLYKELICVCIDNKIILYDKKTKIIKTSTHVYNINSVKFRPKTNQIIFSDLNLNIYIWDYKLETIENIYRTEEISFRTDLLRLFFDIDLDGKYLIVRHFPLKTDESIFIFQINSKTKIKIPYFGQQLFNEIYFNVSFNPIKDEFVLASYFFINQSLSLIIDYKMFIINSKTLECNNIFEGYTLPFYDKSGKLFAVKKNSGVCALIKDSFKIIMETDNLITSLVVLDDIIYLVEFSKYFDTRLINSFNLLTNLKETQKTQYSNIRKMLLGNKCKNLILLNENEVLFLDIEKNIFTKDIYNKEIYNFLGITLNKNNICPIISDFDIKNM